MNSKSANKKKLKVNNGGPVFNLKAVVSICIIAVVVIGLVGGMLYENFKPRLVLTINDDKIYLSDIMYYIYETEAQYDYMDQLYQSFYGSSYWDQTDDDGNTYRETAKDEMIDAFQQDYVLYKEAIEAGYELTDEDKDNAQDALDSLRKNLSTAQKGLTGMTKKNLLKILQKKEVASRYKQDIIDGFDIDDDAIKDGVDYETYRQYDVQYYSIAITSTDSDGNSVEATDEEKEAYLAELKALAERAETEDFDSLTPQAVEATEEAEETEASEGADTSEDTDETEATDDDTEYTSTFTADGKFVSGDGTFDTAIEKKLMKLENGEVSAVIKGDSAYYLVKMVNNDDSEAYDEEVENQITEEENTQFDDWFEEVGADYTVTANAKVYNQITMGEMVIDK